MTGVFIPGLKLLCCEGQLKSIVRTCTHVSCHLFKKCIISKQKNFELFQMGKCAEKCKKNYFKKLFLKTKHKWSQNAKN